MLWLLVEGDRILAEGSWQAVIEAGEELGFIRRRFREEDGFETAPQMLVRFATMAPASMFARIPEEAACG